MTLETHYRRLIGWFPREHRVEYGNEMIGVLMAESRPGQRFPAPGDAVDLMWAGLGTRLGHVRKAAHRSAWRDASAVVGLLAASLLLAVAASRLIIGLHYLRHGEAMRAYGVDGLLLADVGLRTAIWLTVVVAALAGLRRTAFGAAVAGAVIEAAALTVWLPVEQFRLVRMAWLPVVVALAVVALALARRARPPLRVLGTRGTVLLTVAVLLVLAPAVNTIPFLGRITFVSGEGFGLPSPAAVLTAALMLAGVWQTGRRIRRRVLVLLSPLPVLIVAQQATWQAFGMSFAPEVTVPMVIVQVALITVVPLLVLSAGVRVLRAREQRVRT